MAKKIVVLIDGGYLRVCSLKAHRAVATFKYDPDFIEKVALDCRHEDEEILRVLYYDCAPYNGTVSLPVSGMEKTFQSSDEWLRTLARKDLFAVRLGVLKFRGFKPKRIPVAAQTLSDADFKPVFEQKGVDMRIGLDIGLYAQTRAIDRIVLLSGDTDCVAAMKHARKAGLQMVLVKLATENLAGELLAHADFTREVAWPEIAPLANAAGA